MDERNGTVRLVESRKESEGRTLVATVSRADVEEALRGEQGPVDLLLDVERVAADGDGRETGRIALGWEPEDLERLLAQASSDEITLTFDEAELQRLLDEDVEAHGMRERLAVLTVVAGIAAGGAGAATAAVYGGNEGGGPTTAPAVTQVASEVSTGLTAAAAVTPSEVSTGVGVGAPSVTPVTPSEVSSGITAPEPAAPPSEISTGIVQEPAPSAPEVTTGITAEPSTPVASSPSAWSPSPETLALVAGTILALTALGFAARTQHHRPKMS
jgi:hypothetical protein